VPSIRVTWPHTREPQEARRAIEAVARDLRERLGASYHWEGEELRFKATGARGRIRVEPQTVVVEVDLGLALLPLRGRIEAEVRSRLATTLV